MTLPLTYDKHGRRGAVFGDQPSYLASLCDPVEGVDAQAGVQPRALTLAQTSPLTGAGLTPPSVSLFRATAPAGAGQS